MVNSDSWFLSPPRTVACYLNKWLCWIKPSINKNICFDLCCVKTFRDAIIRNRKTYLCVCLALQHSLRIQRFSWVVPWRLGSLSWSSVWPLMFTHLKDWKWNSSKVTNSWRQRRLQKWWRRSLWKPRGWKSPLLLALRILRKLLFAELSYKWIPRPKKGRRSTNCKFTVSTCMRSSGLWEVSPRYVLFYLLLQ